MLSPLNIISSFFFQKYYCCAPPFYISKTKQKKVIKFEIICTSLLANGIKAFTLELESYFCWEMCSIYYAFNISKQLYTIFVNRNQSGAEWQLCKKSYAVGSPTLNASLFFFLFFFVFWNEMGFVCVKLSILSSFILHCIGYVK